MTDAKEELNRIRVDGAKIEDKLEELEKLKTLATKVTAVMGGEAVSRSRNTDTMGDAVARIVEMQDEIADLIDSYISRKKYFSQIIDSLRNPMQIKVLYGRYYSGKPFEDIAQELGYTRRNICYIHGAALRAVEDIIKERENSNDQDERHHYPQG